MISKNEIKYYSSLLHKKYRQQERKFIAEGDKLIREGIESGFRPEVILTTLPFYESQQEYFDSLKNFRTETIKTPELKKLSNTNTPQQVLAVFPFLKNELNINKIKSKLLVYLDNISDPGNLGTIIRNCDWFGITEVLLSEESVELYNPKVVRSGMGSVFHLNVYENINTEILIELKNKGYNIICADLEGEDIYNFDLPVKSIVVFSNEAHGPNEAILKLTDHIISIKKKGKAESLNVASASAVILSVLTR
jgi:RNA methyltransferase, TrmH family